MNGVIYARYSSDNQREESIEGQLRECMDFASRNDIQIVGTYIDRALSAKTDNRPEFQRMIKDSAKHLFDTIIVWKLDRFSRNRYDSAWYKNILNKNKVRLISATEAISNAPEGILMESILVGYAEYYSAELAQKVVRGMTENALKCVFNGGQVAIGYYIGEDRHYHIDPVTAPVIVEAFERYAGGEPMEKISQFLQNAGVKTSAGKTPSLAMVTRMLHNRRYIGEYKFRDTVVPDGIPAIISEELFDKVQARMARTKKAPSQHKADDEYILTTKLRCGKCKCLMIGESGRSKTRGVKHRYYKCVSVKYHKGCDKKTVRKEWIEDLVIDQIKKLIFDDELIGKLADQLIEELSKESTILPSLKKQLADTEKGIINMVNAIQSGIVTVSTKERLEELEKQRETLKYSILKEESERPTIDRDMFVAWLTHFRDCNTSDTNQRQRLVDLFVNVIYLYDDHLDLFLNFRENAETIPIDDTIIKSSKKDKGGGGEKSSDKTAVAPPTTKGMIAWSSLLLFS